MYRRLGLIIIVGALLPVSVWAANSGRNRDVAQNKDEQEKSSTSDKQKDTPAVVEDKSTADTTASKATVSKSAESKSAANRPKAKGKAIPGITPEREAAVKTFVERHHPELAELLLDLKENNPKEYEKGIRDLFRTSERLARTHEESLDRYELELKLWQTQSKIDLLSAKYKMTPSDEIKNQLRDAVTEQVELRRGLLKLEQQKINERLTVIKQQLTKMDKGQKDFVENQLKTLTGTVEKEKPKKAAAKAKANAGK